MSDAGGGPPPVPRRKLPGWLVAVLVLCGVLALICTGGAIWAWNATADLRAIAEMPESERARGMSDYLRKSLGTTDKALLDLVTAVAEDRDDDAWAQTSDGFRATTNRASFSQIAATLRNRLGKPVEMLVRKTNYRKMAGIGDTPSGSTVELVYDATFERGKGTVTATMIEVAPGQWKVHGWFVQSPAFLDPPAAPAAPAAPEPAPAPERDPPK